MKNVKNHSFFQNSCMGNNFEEGSKVVDRPEKFNDDEDSEFIQK